MSGDKAVTQKKSILNSIWTGLFTLMYPFILVFSFACIAVIHLFSLLSRLISMLPLWKKVPTEQASEQVPEWRPFAHIGSLKIESKLEDEIMFGPAYYKLKANQTIREFSECYFGDFQVPCFDGILLQKWNTLIPKQLPDFDLMFLNAKTGTLHHIKTIKSFSWKVEQETDKVILWFDEKKEEGKLIIRAADLQFKAAI
ncbi:hypothetical protein [Catalinimonas niigatensis]|uniref:hypothetical protein n=1 Tax=Catalinimonas niigatensis TaxID=1397264 RepID=UPI0026654764|nr:hypothetical protein [Catalinimonas niigatensis]WPP48502.1 hypothetical protein PZB72_17665 [Catalinimonas niigatensis]